jgi:hypothetical protein
MKLFFVATVLMFTTFISTANSIEKVVTVETGSGVLEGTLKTVKAESIKSMALIISGSGPTDRDGNNPSMVNN